MEHRYQLEAYKGMRSRYECPACHHKGVFVRYIDTQTGEYLAPDVGRCNREDHCGYHYTPKQYFADHPEKSPINSRVGYGEGKNNTHKVTPKMKAQSKEVDNKPERIDRIPKEYIIKSLGYDSNFIRFLLSLFDRYLLECPTIQRLMSEYYLGCTKSGEVIYWQIDSANRIRTGKIMQYDPITGKRLKKTSGAIDWVHSKLKKAGILPEDWELSQCLFGEHLLRKRPSDTVCLVEGEKTAIIGSGMMPKYVWLATGSKQNLKADICQCLKGRNVILFPDLGAFEQWKSKGEEIAQQVGFTLTLFDALERIATPEEREAGLDIADYLIRQIQASNEDITPVTPLTREEKILQQMSAKNPAVMQLISSLGLVSATTGQTLLIQ